MEIALALVVALLVWPWLRLLDPTVVRRQAEIEVEQGRWDD